MRDHGKLRAFILADEPALYLACDKKSEETGKVLAVLMRSIR